MNLVDMRGLHANGLLVADSFGVSVINGRVWPANPWFMVPSPLADLIRHELGEVDV